MTGLIWVLPGSEVVMGKPVYIHALASPPPVTNTLYGMFVMTLGQHNGLVPAHPWAWITLQEIF